MRKRIIYYNQTEAEALKFCAKVIDFGVSLTLTTALNESLNAYLMIRDSNKIYKSKLKSLVNLAKKKADLQKNTIMSIMRHRKFFDDYSDKVIDLAETDISAFRNEIKNLLEKEGHEDCEIISQCETVRVLLELSKLHYEMTLERTKEKFHCRLADKFEEFDPSDILGAWNNVCKILFSNRPSTDLNTKDIKDKFNILWKKFADGVYIEDCQKEAMALNPDFKENVVKLIDKDNW